MTPMMIRNMQQALVNSGAPAHPDMFLIAEALVRFQTDIERAENSLNQLLALLPVDCRENAPSIEEAPDEAFGMAVESLELWGEGK